MLVRPEHQARLEHPTEEVRGLKLTRPMRRLMPLDASGLGAARLLTSSSPAAPSSELIPVISLLRLAI